MSTPLPVASAARVRRAVRHEVAADRGAFVAILLLNALAAGAGLVGPWLLGTIVNTVRSSTGPAAVSTVDRLALLIVVATLAQIVLSRHALRLGARFGERAAARIRERFLDRTLALPAAVVEHTSTGDLTTRGTTDVDDVATALRTAAPEVLIASAQALFIIGAVLVLDPLLGVCGLSCLVVITVVLRWYLRRARPGYIAEGAANSVLAEVLATTADGARTVDALRLQQRRLDAAEAAITEARRTRLHTLWLRSVLFPSVDISYALPVVGVLLVGGVLYDHGAVDLGAVVASAIYLRQLIGPLDTVLLWVEQLQSSTASYARVEGLAAVPGTGPATAAEPADDRIEVAGVRYAYRRHSEAPDGAHDSARDDTSGARAGDVLHGVDLDVRSGERLAVVGPSGAGKSTLGRLLAGIDRPRAGTVTAGGVPVADLPPERMRRQIALVTQEHHVFQDTLRNNLLIARPSATDARLRAALDAVHARWIDDLPAGLDTDLGSDGHHLDGPQAQQLSLARVILADPHTVILDEATALLDPAAARDTERALAAALRGRTVIAIAHRLQTAHDADRIAVMDAGLVTELGPHDELVARGGGYAALWRSWHGS
ncbi:ABC transporter ATP-binding protein [Streptomyces sp. H39-S7]|uniref:ABC transporter ATP-binding protein n=1 Tax=Streptomyces sp. H39-S7 TaxID=3004357 RepID=UPI0022B012BB|nr:ABC transporter ATP-binding protein [Streptomyces sp. H39-S7]MCZ4119885.1 ABC transporter ATP-binding protein [Streptomyces sp. H39-S7]